MNGTEKGCSIQFLYFSHHKSLFLFYNKVAMKLFDFLRKKQQIVCVEVLFDHIRWGVVELDVKKNSMRLLEYADTPFDISKEGRGFIRALGETFRRLRRRKKQYIVLGFHEKVALTTRSNASVGRRQTDQSLQEPELEDLLFKAQWKVFDNVRRAASMRMGISDLDLHLTDAKVEGVRLDGHRVINPVGFRPRRIEFDIINTFVSKEVIREVRGILSDKQQLELVIERNAALANTLLRMHRRDDGIVFSVDRDTTSILVIKNRNLLYHQQFSWGYASVVNTVSRFLSLRLAAADQVLQKYLQKDMSPSFARKIEKEILRDANLFFEGITYALDSLKRTVQLPDRIFLNQETVVPAVIVSKMKSYQWPSRFFKNSPRVRDIEPFVLAEELHLGYSVSNSFAALLSEFLYGEKGEYYLNEILHRRVRWLEV